MEMPFQGHAVLNCWLFVDGACESPMPKKAQIGGTASLSGSVDYGSLCAFRADRKNHRIAGVVGTIASMALVQECAAGTYVSTAMRIMDMQPRASIARTVDNVVRGLKFANGRNSTCFMAASTFFTSAYCWAGRVRTR